MHGIIGDLALERGSHSHIRQAIAPGPFDPAIAVEEFVFAPLERWARETPDKMALVSADASLTYADLHEATNRIARALRARGIQRGARVALVLPRGHEAILAMVGVLKAGAAYVPLDAETPAERVRLCLEDAAPELVIARQPGGVTDSYTAVLIDTLLREASVLPSSALTAAETGLKSSDLAYIIFTSGTTGRPKGVPISHRSLTNFVRGDQETCIRVLPEDKVFQGFSPASDGHHEEVWPTFLAGATLVVATLDDIHSGHELGGFLDRHGVTIISCAPTLLSMVEQDVPSIRRILFGAERCPAEIVRRWHRPGREIINTYGPTEATVGATFGLCTPDTPITIGRPLPNYYCYIIDAEFEPVAQGREGELCIAGIGVSRGYLGNEALTTEKFIPNPFACPGEHNEVLYRTGDRARLNADGNIEWLGRIDSQVKIRGYRIELSDIESHLLDDETVRSAIVIVREADSPSPRLIALLVPKTGTSIDATACLARLRRELPSYMAPQALEEVDVLPVLPSGKLDRKSAQSLRGRRLEQERKVVAPRTDTERMLYAIWQQLFAGAQVSCADDFFTDLGGYSLLATRFISILRGEHRLHAVSVLDIYEHPTLEGFAAYLDSQHRAQHTPQRSVPEFAPVPPGRYALAALVQGLCILFLFGFRACFWLAPVVTASYCANVGLSPLACIAAGLLLHAVSVPLSLLLALALKWTVGGRFRAGRYPVWGGYFLRWWFAQRAVELAPISYITGTPLASWFLRRLGAKVGHNVTLETLEIDCPDLVEIGDDCVVESYGWIRTSHVAHGYLTLSPVKIGAGCTVGARSGVAGGATLGNGVYLAELSCVREGVVVPDGEEWAGSPAQRREPTVAPYDPAKQPTAAQRVGFGALQSLLALALSLIDTIPFLITALVYYRLSDHVLKFLAVPAYSLFLVLAACGQILLVKWVVAGRVRPGTYRMPGLFYLRKWFTDKHLELLTGVIVPIYDSLYARPWCIALGMKCGPRTEIALPTRLPYDLLAMGEEGFLASDTTIGTPLRRNGEIVLETTTTGRRAFLGNDSVIPQGSRIPDDTLLGALSVCPETSEMGSEPGQAWMGSPAFRMPRREHFDRFEQERTYRPTKRLYARRLACETIRIILPGTLTLAIAALLINGFVFVWHASSLLTAVLAAPLLYLVAGMVGTAAMFAFKKLLIGRYKPTVQPLWSQYVWNTETFSAIFHDFGAPLFISSLMGTPYLSMFLRLMGAKVGRRAFIHTNGMTEFDLIAVGDDAAINYNGQLQAHLFEDRVMKVGKVTIGDRCSVGANALVLFDSELEADSHLADLSLIMKGETIPSGTVWEGSPAQAQGEQRPHKVNCQKLTAA